MSNWYEGPLASFDTETTGVDVEHDRIVTAALVVQESAGGPVRRRDWAADPGVPIPEGATAVHGLTDRWAREHGMPRHVFARVPAEDKPIYVDFNSPILIDLLARGIRRSQEMGEAESPVRLSEMVPGPSGLWLPDGAGRRYTCELRTLVTDRSGLV